MKENNGSSVVRSNVGGTKKDPDTGMMIEVAFSVFGFLGIGHIWAGNTLIGILLLVFYMIGLVIEWLVLGMFAIATCGVGMCLFIAYPIQNVIFGVVSGLFVKDYLGNLDE